MKLRVALLPVLVAVIGVVGLNGVGGGTSGAAEPTWLSDLKRDKTVQVCENADGTVTVRRPLPVPAGWVGRTDAVETPPPPPLTCDDPILNKESR